MMISILDKNQHPSIHNKDVVGKVHQSYIVVDDDFSSWRNTPTIPKATTNKIQHQGEISFNTGSMQEKNLPKDTDVIIGNGGRVMKHPGNKYFKNIINSKVQEYACFSLRREKTNMIRSIVHQIHENGGTFIRKNPASGSWFEVDDVIAREKISQAFRNSIYRNCNRPSGTFSITDNFSSMSSTTIAVGSIKRKVNTSAAVTKRKRNATMNNVNNTNTNNQIEKKSSSLPPFTIRSSPSIIKKSLSSSLSPTMINSPPNNNIKRKKQMNFSQKNDKELETMMYHHGLKIAHTKNHCNFVCVLDSFISSLPLQSIGCEDPFEPIPI